VKVQPVRVLSSVSLRKFAYERWKKLFLRGLGIPYRSISVELKKLGYLPEIWPGDYRSEFQISLLYPIMEVTNQAILEVLFIGVSSKEVRSRPVVSILREFFLDNLEKAVKGEVSVYRPFTPNKRQRQFLDWIVENSSRIRSQMRGFSYGELERLTGINRRTLKHWYDQPEFVGWINKEIMSRFGAAVSLLKGSMIAEALAPSSTFQEREFALELAGEIRKNFPQSFNVVILGEGISVGSKENSVGSKEKEVGSEEVSSEEWDVEIADLPVERGEAIPPADSLPAESQLNEMSSAEDGVGRFSKE